MINVEDPYETVGIIFNPTMDEVLLIEKTHPEHLAGLLNGVGGKANPTETPCECMAREAMEESGLQSKPSDWSYIEKKTLESGVVLHFFTIIASNPESIKTKTKECVDWYSCAGLPENVMEDIPAIIDQARQKIAN